MENIRNLLLYKVSRDIIYANTMSQAAAKQTFGECARAGMERSENTAGYTRTQ